MAYGKPTGIVGRTGVQYVGLSLQRHIALGGVKARGEKHSPLHDYAIKMQDFYS